MAGPYPSPPQRDSLFAPLSIDLLLRVFKTSFLHPFIAWIVPLCFRAQGMYWTATPMLVSFAWAALVSVSWILAAVNRRIAYGLPRAVVLPNEVVVITGGASGLGLLMAEMYGMRGATVAVLDVRDMENTEVRGVNFYRCDVSDKDQVARVAEEIEKELGPPTILINNAAVVIGKRLLDMTLPEIDRSLATNLLAHFYTLKAFLPALARAPAGATVVTLSSVIGQLGAAGLTDYAAAKAGVAALHRSLAAELAQTHPRVRTVLVAPGQISTPLFHGLRTPRPFLAPVVEPVDAARQVVAAIDSGRHAEVAMPFYARWVDWYDVLPASLQRLARRLAGVDLAMRTFVGRQGLDEARTKTGRYEETAAS